MKYLKHTLCYLVVVIVLVAATLYFPLEIGRNSAVAYETELFREYVKVNRVEYIDPQNKNVQEIMKNADKLNKQVFVEKCGIYSLISCFIGLICTYFLPCHKKIAPLLLGGYFGMLFSMGAMEKGFFVAILLMVIMYMLFIQKKPKRRIN